MASIRNLYPSNIAKRFREWRWMRAADSTIVIAGMGRSGTTLLQRALTAQGWVSRKHDFLVSLENREYRKGVVYKTHAYPPRELPAHVKLVYMFGSPKNIVVSAYAKGLSDERFTRKHYQHLHAEENLGDHRLIFQKDTLKLAQQFDEWLRPQPFPFISVKYEALYTGPTMAALSDYLGCPVALPPFRQRQANWENSEHRQQLSDTYDALESKVLAAPDFRIWGSSQ